MCKAARQQSPPTTVYNARHALIAQRQRKKRQHVRRIDPTALQAFGEPDIAATQDDTGGAPVVDRKRRMRLLSGATKVQRNARGINQHERSMREVIKRVEKQARDPRQATGPGKQAILIQAHGLTFALEDTSSLDRGGIG